MAALNGKALFPQHPAALDDVSATEWRSQGERRQIWQARAALDDVSATEWREHYIVNKRTVSYSCTR